MNTLDLWKNVEYLSVDEFMCLLFGLEPGTVKFDYGNPRDWPEQAAVIYRILTDDIQAKKLHVTFDDTWGDPFINGAYDRFYAGTDNPWWADGGDLHTIGKLLKKRLVKWLAEKDIQSDFFGVAATEENRKKTGGVNTTDSGPDQPVEYQTSPKSTGSRKDIIRIKETRQACEDVREELYQEKQVFDTDRDNWNPKLLFSTSKTTKEAFMTAVQKRLGGKPHRDVADEEWKTVSTDLKHRGRLPEQ